MRRITTILAAVLLFAVSAAHAAHTQATLLLSADTVKSGDTIYAGIDLRMQSGWHTYWKNSGAAGLPTKIDWQLPAGITAGDIQWPLPEKFPPVEVTTYGYENEVILIVPLKVDANAAAGPIDLKAKVSWLECSSEVCIPANQDVTANLTIGSETKNSADAAKIDDSKAKVPKTGNQYQLQAWWENQSNPRTLVIGNPNPMMANKNTKYDSIDFFPYASDNLEVQSATKIISDYSANLKLSKEVKKFSGDWPKKISGIVVIESGKQRTGFEINLPIADKEPASTFDNGRDTLTSSPSNSNAKSQPASSIPSAIASATVNAAPTGEVNNSTSLPLMLLYAFIGGLILNIMPCVLPVIALKILGFVSEARSEPQRVRNLGFIYALGVLASFLTMAGIVIGVTTAGHHAGWGMQFGSPIFVVCLATLVTLVALNLFGVFEITPGGKMMDAAGHLASRHGAPGAFFNGLLATILATPCTAPFLASALGFAFTQSAVVIVLIFLFVALGLAAPYVVLSCNPSLLKFLPKPGAWMEKFKIAMGFPMLATVVWLFGVAASDYGARVFWLGVFLVGVALAAWIFGEFVQRGQRKGLALVIAVVVLTGNYLFSLENKLHWREMVAATDTVSLVKSSDGINWQPWSPQAVADARAAGKPVLVDFTASWCVTCNAIIKPALENDSITSKLKESDAVTLLADYTRTPQEMTDEIAKYGGAGVPLVLVYPKDSNAAPIVLPQPAPLQLPSGYSKIVLAALERAVKD